MPVCPHTGGDARGWLGLGHGRAKGHPKRGPWRQLPCTACEGSLPAHHGTIFHGTQAEVELRGRGLAGWAAGLGLRATARVLEVDANTVWHGLVEAAEPLTAFAAYLLGDLHGTQRQLDELSAVLSAVKEGESPEAKGIKR